MIRRRGLALALALALVGAAITACSDGSSDSSGSGSGSSTSGASGTSGLGTLRVSMVPNLIATGLPWVAESLGLFKPLGLTVKFVYSGSGPTATQAWLAGSADVNAGSGLNLPSLSDQGVGYKVIAGVADSGAYQMLERKGLNAPAGDLSALKGKKMCSIGTFVDTLFRALAADAGLSKKDITLIELASFPAVTAAIGQGQCDFTIATQPFTSQMVSQAGAKVWRDLQTDGPADVRSIPNIAFVAKSAYASAHADQLKAFVQGMAQAAQLAKTDPAKVTKAAISVVKPADTAAFTQQATGILKSWSPNLTATQINYTNHLLVDVQGLNKTKPDPASILWPDAAPIFQKYGIGS
jgi:ABC-type nitrate/sulfonate/bicarbonate transport system substrate-binding protein